MRLYIICNYIIYKRRESSVLQLSTASIEHTPAMCYHFTSSKKAPLHVMLGWDGDWWRFLYFYSYAYTIEFERSHLRHSLRHLKFPQAVQKRLSLITRYLEHMPTILFVLFFLKNQAKINLAACSSTVLSPLLVASSIINTKIFSKYENRKSRKISTSRDCKGKYTALRPVHLIVYFKATLSTSCAHEQCIYSPVIHITLYTNASNCCAHKHCIIFVDRSNRNIIRICLSWMQEASCSYI